MSSTLWRVWWRLARLAPWLTARSILLQLGRMAIQFAPAPVIGRLLDRLIALGGLTPELWTLVGLLIGVALARLAILLGAVWSEATLNYLQSALLRVNLLAALTRRPGALPLPVATGDLLGRLTTDSFAIATGLNFTLLESLGLLVAAVVVALMARINLVLTVAAVVPLLLAALVSNRAGALIGHYRRISRAAEGEVTAFLREAFSAVAAIQVARAEERATAHLIALNERRRGAALRDQLFQNVVMVSLLDNVAYIATGAVLLLAGRYLRAGTFSVGDLALFAYLLPILGDFLLHVGMMISTTRGAAIAVERVAALVDDDPSRLTAPQQPLLSGPLPDPPVPARTASDRLDLLTARGLTWRYDESGRGIRDVDLTLPRGSVTVIIGRVGAGKTTLLRALLGLLPAEGEVRWNGSPVTDCAAFFQPPRCAYTPQAPRLLSEPLRDAILLGAPEGRLDRALAITALGPDIATLEEGLSTVVGPRGTRLSGGQLQRVAAARMLVREAELIVCDDLGSALDAPTERQLWERLLAVATATGQSCLLVSHRPALLRRADQIVVLDEGVVVGHGTLAALLRECAPLRALWREWEEGTA